MKVAECGFARATWPYSERTRLSVKSERARASAYCDSVSRPWSRARVSASCLAGVSGGSGRGAAEAGAAADHAQVASRRTSASLAKRMADVTPDPVTAVARLYLPRASASSCALVRLGRREHGGAQRGGRDDSGPRSRLRPAGRCDGERPFGGQCGAGELRPPQGRDGGGRRGAHPLPHARAARDAVRAQRLPVPHPRPDLRRARVVPAPGRLLQRVQHALRDGDGRVLRPRAGGRALSGRQAGRLLLRARHGRARADDPRGARRGLRRRLLRPTSGSSSRASPASSRGRSCQSAPTPSSIGRSTPEP